MDRDLQNIISKVTLGYLSYTQEEKIVDRIESWHKEQIKRIRLCPSNFCQKGKVLCKDGSSAVEDCPVCLGNGWIITKGGRDGWTK
jgi:hypothetical protein